MTALFDILGFGAENRDQKGVFPLFSKVLATARQRADLAKLEPHMLDDLGLTQADVEKELNRPVWDVPNHWRR